MMLLTYSNVNHRLLRRVRGTCAVSTGVVRLLVIAGRPTRDDRLLRQQRESVRRVPTCGRSSIWSPNRTEVPPSTWFDTRAVNHSMHCPNAKLELIEAEEIGYFAGHSANSLGFYAGARNSTRGQIRCFAATARWLSPVLRMCREA